MLNCCAGIQNGQIQGLATHCGTVPLVTGRRHTSSDFAARNNEDFSPGRHYPLTGRLDGARWRECSHKTAKDLSSGHILAGMELLLAWCGWICGGTEGAQNAITRVSSSDDVAFAPNALM